MSRETYQKLPSLSRSSPICGVVHLFLLCNFCSFCRPAWFPQELVVAVFLSSFLVQVPAIHMCGASCALSSNIQLKVLGIRSSGCALRQLNFFLVWKTLHYTII